MHENNFREYLIDFLKKLRANLCCYSLNGVQSRICDCKYGYDGKRGGENTGCPELHDLILTLERLTDEEFNLLRKRK